MKFPKFRSKGEGKIQHGIYAYQEPATIEGRMGMQYTEETIRDGQCMCAQGWFTPTLVLEHKKLLEYKEIR
jgi:hypothetical protein